MKLSEVDQLVPHEIWMSVNCGVPDGGCSCPESPRPDGGFNGVSFTEIGRVLGVHLNAVLLRRTS